MNLANYLKTEGKIDVESLKDTLIRYLNEPQCQYRDIDIVSHRFLLTFQKVKPIEEFLDLLLNEPEDSNTGATAASSESKIFGNNAKVGASPGILTT